MRCHEGMRERTYEGICPYFEASPPNHSPNGITPPSLPQGEECLAGAGQEKVSLKQRRRFLDVKKASLRYEETPSSNEEEAFLNYAMASDPVHAHDPLGTLYSH